MIRTVLCDFSCGESHRLDLLNRSELILPQPKFATTPEFPSYKTDWIGTFPRSRDIFGV